MSTFAGITIARGIAPPKPLCTVVLTPADFCEDWAGRPKAEVAIGLRRVCDTARQAAAQEATNYVRKAFLDGGGSVTDDVIDEWNNSFIAQSMAYAMCNPNDATKPYLPGAQEIIGRAFPAETLARVWAAYHLAVRRLDREAPRANDQDVRRLARLLKAGRLATLEPGVAAEVRRLLHWGLQQFGPDDVEDTDEPEEDVYLVTGQ